MDLFEKLKSLEHVHAHPYRGEWFTHSSGSVTHQYQVMDLRAAFVPICVYVLEAQSWFTCPEELETDPLWEAMANNIAPNPHTLTPSSYYMLTNRGYHALMVWTLTGEHLPADMETTTCAP